MAMTEAPNEGSAARPCAILEAGFRPFFLLAAAYAAFIIPAWILYLSGHIRVSTYLPGVAWHAHEMIFGVIAAAFAGFLLTAVPTWTKRSATAGLPLLCMVGVWLAGRIVATVPLGLPPIAAMAVDLAFPVVIMAAIGPAIVSSKNYRNIIFIAFAGLLLASNFLFHRSGAQTTAPLLLALNTVLVMVSLVGGRIVPAFTGNAFEKHGIPASIRPHRTLSAITLAAVIAVLLIDVARPQSITAGYCAAAAGALLVLRMSCWQGHRSLRLPIVWVLHIGYAWLAIGLGLKAAWILGDFAVGANWKHALTIGAFSTMILGVMSRAALGHTGRPVVAPKAIVTAYVLVTLAAVSRVFGPALAPGAGWVWLISASIFWTGAFGCFLYTFAPMLLRPRIDRESGV